MRNTRRNCPPLPKRVQSTPWKTTTAFSAIPIASIFPATKQQNQTISTVCSASVHSTSLSSAAAISAYWIRVSKIAPHASFPMLPRGMITSWERLRNDLSRSAIIRTRIRATRASLWSEPPARIQPPPSCTLRRRPLREIHKQGNVECIFRTPA